MTGTDAAAPRRGAGSPKIYEALKRDILEMRLAPGDGLDETSLSERFGMSRTPVREALVRLVAEGLATTLPNRNTVVTALDFANLPNYLDALTLMYRVTTRLAAGRRRPEHLALMREQQGRFAACVAAADAIGMIETNRDFHLAIAAAGGNRYYTDLFARLLNEGMRLLRLYYRTFEDHLPRRYVEEHEAIIAAIAEGDAERADRLGAEHAAQIVAQFQRFLEPRLGTEIALGA
ncbi:GntR family transcriptional regulator [Labrys wisconsinensis]|uniref:DNA-binding GntR family transcriptional regulator n=1 Tax=Labrys wisconsinensis TaxID=425677 RepID=A0ABU0IZC3_9HYPH|nr:GntR family transcriptional regulator [Labrys wisconsinensis]MDQ0467359.1 DNA-binding GntR family transcriptional regulator [Labrys wisconsinensis]